MAAFTAGGDEQPEICCLTGVSTVSVRVAEAEVLSRGGLMVSKEWWKQWPVCLQQQAPGRMSFVCHRMHQPSSQSGQMAYFQS